jgi:hypothetical protein
MRVFLLAASLCLLSPIAFAQAPPAPPAGVELLPPGDGRDLVIKTCSKCHALNVITQQTYDAAGWKDVVIQMANNGADASDDEFTQIVAYLTKAFPAK